VVGAPGVARPRTILKPTLAARIHATLTAVVCAFQLALAVGLPWGKLAMGGQFPGQLPPAMRVAAIAQLLILALLSLVVLTRAGLVLEKWRGESAKLVWVVVAISAVSVIANLATPSMWERIVWAPVALGLLGCSVVVARSEWLRH
jgi:hypothetical protein